MIKDLLVGVDLGTTGSKAGIFTTDGKMLGSGYYEYPCIYPKPGWVDQDVELLVESAMKAVKDALETSAVDPDRIAGVSFSTQRCCTIFLDENNKLIRPMISWMDNRPVDEVAEINEKVAAAEYLEKTGFPNSTTWMLPKMMWLRKNEPENWKRTARVVQLQDYMLAAMGADGYFCDVSDARYYGFWDPYNFCWNDELIETFDIDKSLLPEIKPSGTLVGVVSEEAAARSGLPAGTPIIVGAGDQNAASVGAGAVHPGYMFVSLGTAGATGICLNQEYRDPTGRTFVTDHPCYGDWMLEGYQPAAAGVFRWFRDEIARLESAEAEKSGEDIYDVLSKMVDSVPPGAKGLVFIPQYASAATPRFNPEARGVLAGMTFAHDRNCLARAYMEGITMEMNDIIRSVRDTGNEVKAIRILGGPTNSKVWNQMQADMYGLEIDTLEVADAAVLGAAVMAGAGVGLFEGIAEGADAMVKLKDHYLPNAKANEVYEQQYKLYCRLYESLEQGGFYSELAAFQNLF
jgi:xylulokinase